MTLFLVWAAVLAAVAVALLARPSWKPASADITGGGDTSAQRPAFPLIALLAVFMVAVTAAGYWRLGAPQHLALGPGSGSTAEAAQPPEGAASSPSREQVAMLAEQLAQKLKVQPNDAGGWHMLARMYMALEKTPEAIEAFKRSVELQPNDPDALIDYANALVQTSGQSLSGEPAQLIERAVKAAPENPKALAMAGAVAFDRQDYQGAVRHWESLAKMLPAESPLLAQVQSSVAEARRRGGLPPAETAQAAAGGASAPSGASVQVSGTVKLSPSLQGKVSPDDTVFVFARPASGPGMPLAIVRKQVKDLPLQFTLDDSLAMSPAARISSASKVVVGARVSKSGNAMPQNGDFQGQLPGVAVGASGLVIEINEVVQR